MRNTFIKICAALSLLAVALPAGAVKARPEVHAVANPDGSTLTYSLVGDEHFHFYATADGLPIVEQADGTWCYAATSPSGVFVSTGVRATDAQFRPASVAKLLADARPLAEVRRIRESAAPRSLVNRAPAEMRTSNFPVFGRQKTLVVLVEYSDVAFSVADPHDYFSRLLNEPGFTLEGGTGSARDYFLTASAGQFEPVFDLFGPVKLPEKRAYYGKNDIYGNDENPHKMVVHACDILKEQGVDFSEYDRNGDGVIDNVYLIYAGRGEATGGPKASVWPHAYYVYSGAGEEHIYDKLILDHYACSNELLDARLTPDGIGTLTHELSHVFGLPDLYQVDYSAGSAVTPDAWDIMDIGSYNNNSRTPPTYNAFERMSMGWLKPVEITQAADITIPAITENIAYLISTDTDSDFFLFENRRREGWDSFTPGHGMLAWHIDYDPAVWRRNAVNDNPSHQRVDIVEAYPRQGYQTSASPADLFPGTRSVTTLTAETTPALKAWNGFAPEYPLTEIAETPEGAITLKAAGGGATEIASPVIKRYDSNAELLRWYGVPGASGYLVTVVDSIGSPVYINAPATALTTFRLSSLPEGKRFTATVRAIGNSTLSAPSEPVTFVAGQTDGIITPDAPAVEITPGRGEVTVSGSDLPAEVYTLQGALIYRGLDRQIPLPAGLYIIKVDATVKKVRVM